MPDKPAALIRRRCSENPDEKFFAVETQTSLLTPSEVRSIAISELELNADSIFWDVGAGSGSVAVEVAGVADRGHVYAIEMDAEDYGLLVENTQRFGIRNLTPVLGQAPEAWKTLPDPDAIFVGGTGALLPNWFKPLATATRRRCTRRKPERYGQCGRRTSKASSGRNEGRFDAFG